MANSSLLSLSTLLSIQLPTPTFKYRHPVLVSCCSDKDSDQKLLGKERAFSPNSQVRIYCRDSNNRLLVIDLPGQGLEAGT